MKLYWKSLVIAIIVVLTIPIFYVKSSLISSESKLDLVHEKESGDEKYLQKLIIEADAQFRNSGYTQMKLVGNELINRNNEGFNSRMNDDYNKPELIKGYEKDYRNFMRGKNNDKKSFIESDEYIVYVEIDEPRNSHINSEKKELYVSVLDKKTKETKTFKEKISVTKGTYFIYLLNISLEDNILNVMTSAELESQKKIDNYALNIVNQTIINQEEIMSIDTTNNGDIYEDLSTINVDNTSTDLIINRERTEVVDEAETINEYGEEEITTNKYYHYNIPNKELKELQFENIDSMTAIDVNEGKFIYSVENKGKLKVESYDLEKLIVDKIAYHVSDQIASDQFMSGAIHDNALYMFYNDINKENEVESLKIEVINLNDMKNLYTGSVIIKNTDIDLDYIDFQSPQFNE